MNISKKPSSSPEFLKFLLDNSSLGIVAFDNNHNVTFSNKQALIHHGSPSVDRMTNRWKDYITVMDPEGSRIIPDHELPVAQAFRGKKVVDQYCLLRRKNHPDILIKYNASPLLDETGIQIGVIVTSEDSEDLAQSVARFRAIFDESPLSIQILDRWGKTLLINKAFLKLWSFPEEFQEHVLGNYNLLEDPVLLKNGHMKHIMKAFQGEAHISDPIYYDPADAGFPGRARWTIATMFPLKDSRGQVREVVLIHQDITEPQQSRAEKERLLAKLDAILKQMPAGVLVVNDKGAIPVYSNKMEDIAGDPLSAKDIFMPQLQRSMQGEVVKNTEVTISKHEERPKTLSVSSGPIYSTNGDITASVVIASDISQRKRKENNEALLNRLKTLLLTTIEYDLIVDKIVDATIPYFGDGCMIDLIVNDSIKRIVTKHKDPYKEQLVVRTRTEYPPQPGSPVPTMRVLDTGKPLLLAKVDSEVIRAGTMNEGHRQLVTQIGATSHLAVPILSKSQDIMGAINFIITDKDRPYYDEMDVEVAKDIAHYASIAIENARLYKEAKSGVQLRDDFISIASHELRTPITSLNLQIEVLNSLVDGLDQNSEIPKVMRKFLDSTNNQLNRLTHLVDDMLDISRITTGKLRLNIKNVNLKNLTQEVLERFEEQLKDKNIELVFNASDDVYVQCDAGRIDQVITNFMTNAIRYGKRKPIHITIEEKAEVVCLKVKDHGRGIYKEDFERIFNRFERAHTSEDVSGLGLGLYINKNIVDEHNGKILLDSEPGKGSTFILELPKIQPTH